MITDEVPVVFMEDLPHYVYCDVDGCVAKHYLQFNRDVQGTWTAGYVEFDGNNACLYINGATTLDEAAVRLQYSLERHKYNEDTRSS